MQDTTINNKLTIDLADDYKIKIERVDEIDTSFFKPVYEQARRNTWEVVTNSLETEKKEQSDREYNNIIAFIGERGTGKSSSMRTYLEILTQFNLDKAERDKAKKWIEDEGNVEAAGTAFHKLEVVDPTLFEEHDDIFEVVLAKMFLEFRRRIETENSQIDQSESSKVLKKFQKVYEELQTLKKDKKERFRGELLDTLSKLASGSNLKESFKSLVGAYLKFMYTKGQNSNHGGKEHFLVIAIDDFDLNIEHATKMAEQIRKYLLQSRIIVLMALKVQQLEAAVEQSFVEKFKTLYDYDRAPSEDPQLMTAKYMEKLLPIDRRVYLPDISTIKKDVDIQLLAHGNLLYGKTYTVEGLILKLIHDKTGLIFLKPPYEAHPLIPDTLREIHNLVKYLYQLPSQDKKAAADRFEEYFTKNWIDEHLGPFYELIIKEFRTKDIRQKNKFIVGKALKVFLEDESIGTLKGAPNLSNLEEITKRFNNPVNISLGDVLFVLNFLSELSDSEEFKRFVFSIKVYYSLLFDRLLNHQKHVIPNLDLTYLLGGSIYSPMTTELIRRDQERKGQRRGHFMFDYSWMKREDYLAREWIHFFINYHGFQRANYRAEEQTYYHRNSNIGKGSIEVENSVFDVLAFVSLLYDPRPILFNALGSLKGEKPEKHSEVVHEVMEWANQYKAALPIYSIELLEAVIFNNNLKEMKKASSGFLSYIQNLFENILTELSNILENQEHLIDDTEIVGAFKTCPFVALILNNEDQETLKTFQKIYYDGEVPLSNSNILKESGKRNKTQAQSLENSSLEGGSTRKVELEPKLDLSYVTIEDIGISEMIFKSDDFKQIYNDFFKTKIVLNDKLLKGNSAMDYVAKLRRELTNKEMTTIADQVSLIERDYSIPFSANRPRKDYHAYQLLVRLFENYMKLLNK